MEKKNILILSPEEALVDILQTVFDAIDTENKRGNRAEIVGLMGCGTETLKLRDDVRALSVRYCELVAGERHFEEDSSIDEIAIAIGEPVFDTSYILCYGKDR
jgi:hypothetical protein